MADWGLQSQDQNTQIITSWGSQSVGALLGCVAPLTSSASTAWGTANRAIYMPFWIGSPFLVKTLAISVGSTQSGNVDAGIYDREQNRLVSNGSVLLGTASAAQQFDVTDTLLLPGQYYMALNLSSTTGTVLCTTVFNNAVGSAAGLLQQAVGATALPNPAAFAAFASSTVGCPWFSVSGRALL